MAAEDLATQRYRLLIDQLDKDYGYGRKKEIERLLHVKQATISRIRSELQAPERETIEKATRPPLGLHPSFFWIRTKTPPHYSDFRGLRGVPGAFRPESFDRFEKAAAGMGMRPTDAETEVLLNIGWLSEPTEQAFFLALQAIRATRRDDDSDGKPPRPEDESSPGTKRAPVKKDGTR